LALQTNFPDALNNLGNLLLNRQPGAAVAAPRTTDPQRTAEAESYLRQALAVQPDFVAAENSLGVLLGGKRRHAEAEANYRRALALQPDFIEAEWNLALLLLAQGRWEEGWRRYEVRYAPGNKSQTAAAPIHLRFPQWRGEDLAGKSIVLWPEQGFGDQIQFCRYAAELRRLGAAQITLVCAAPLKVLFKSLAAVDTVLTMAEAVALPAHDYWSLLLSLPLYCGTDIVTVPAAIPYLAVSNQRSELWAPRLPKTGLRVGLVWKGAVEHKNDQQRSLSNLQALAALWQIPGLVFISLQKGQAEDEAAAPPPGQPLLALGAQIQDFADSAAIVAQLDLLICVDTAIAHLAGALGKPCWVLLPALGADWRWLLAGRDSPWYPGALRLFRLQPESDWRTLVEEVAPALADWSEQQGAKRAGWWGSLRRYLLKV
jgi:tetratricopeptide (TPR) repeat protein